LLDFPFEFVVGLCLAAFGLLYIHLNPVLVKDEIRGEVHKGLKICKEWTDYRQMLDLDSTKKCSIICKYIACLWCGVLQNAIKIWSCVCVLNTSSGVQYTKHVFSSFGNIIFFSLRINMRIKKGNKNPWGIAKNVKRKNRIKSSECINKCSLAVAEPVHSILFILAL